MADIQNRFGKDMLVLSSPVASDLERLGMDVSADGLYTILFEPEVLEEAYKLESIAGAQCVVADTAQIIPARLAHARMTSDAQALADAAVRIAADLRPQHLLVEIGPCGLPLDAASKASLVESRDQYMRAAKLYADARFDAFFLNEFTRVTDLKCALMGIRMVSDAPLFASVAEDVDSLEEAIAVMAEYGADVVGFSTSGDAAEAARTVQCIRDVCALPILVQLIVAKRDPEQENPTPENPYFEPDTMVDAADELRAAGVQFLRAIGDATPAYTGALVAATDRLDVATPEGASVAFDFANEDIDSVAKRLRERVAQAMGKADA